MRCHHEKEGLVWEALVCLPWQRQYTYKYAVVRQSGQEMKVDKWEAEERTLLLPEGLNSGDIVEVMDTWVDRSHPTSILNTSAFTEVIRCTRPPTRPESAAPPRKAPVLGEAIVRLRVADYMVQPGQTICVSGSLPALGNWQQDQPLQLTACEGHWWEGELRVPFTQFPFTYKYAVRRGSEGILLEIGEPRVIALPTVGNSQMGAPSLIVCSDGFFRRDQLWRGAGFALPVFSLRTRDSVGVGEFLDIMKLVDLADKCGFRMIQVLPVNDTCVYGTWWDSYPYSNLSVFALHPQYLSLRALRKELPAEIVAEIAAARSSLEGTHVDYEGTMKAKIRISRKIFDLYGAETLESPEFKEWLADNREWVRPYAAFIFLKDLFQSAEHWQWGLMSKPTPQLLDHVLDPAAEQFPKIQFSYWLQYHLHKQLQQASQHAVSKRVVLKGDLPIGVDKRSVDTWLEPRLFRMDKSTGAPPDYFDPNGQNWGFPTYNWEEMAKDNYKWWQRRLQHLSQYFQAYRIDHVLGFFRIWEVPGDCVTGLLGYFRPSIPLRRQELESRGLWDVERLVQPYIRQHHLNDLFGGMADEVAAKYLWEYSPGCFRFREQYASERQISEIKVREGSPDWLVEETLKTRAGLLKLRHNVVLLKNPEDKDSYFPRFALNSTTSFKELEQSWQEALQWLHDDYYFGRQEDLWRNAALTKLPVLMNSTDMLVCGEDLGFVPTCVPPIMQELGLLGLRIQRMPSEAGKEFNNPANYPYLTVASPSCHDVPPMRAWYEEDSERRDRFFYTMLGGCSTPPEKCTPDVMRIVVQQHLACPSVWAVFPVQDIMALSHKFNKRPASEEVINDPTVSKHYWRYRMHVKVEDLCEDCELVNMLQEMLIISGRALPNEVLDIQ